MAYIFITKGKTNWKYLLIVFILGVIVGSATLWLSTELEFLSVEFPEIKKPEKVEEETANWKTYRDKEYGFTVKYPQDWVTEEAKIEEAQEIVKRILLFSPKNKTYILGGWGNRPPISIMVSKGGIEKYRELYPKQEDAKIIEVNNYSVIRETRTFGEIFYIIENPENGTIVTFENWIKVIERIIELSEEKELEKIFNQMLSTFRFLE